MRSLLDITARDFIEDHVVSPLNSIRKRIAEIKIDLKKEESNYVLEADLPDFKKEEVNVSFENGFLAIEAKKAEEEVKDDGYVIRERQALKLRRSIYVGEVNAEEISASFEDGKLTVLIPFALEESSKKEIIIK